MTPSRQLNGTSGFMVGSCVEISLDSMIGR